MKRYSQDLIEADHLTGSGLRMTKLEGGCSCGAVRFALQSEPMFVNCCHCLDCQRQTGSVFVVNAVIETERIIIGKIKPVPVPVPTDSGRPHDIYRCPQCWTALWSDYGHRPGLRFVRVGTLDDKNALSPDAHIFVRSKVSWLALPKDVPAFEVFYNLKAQWPHESLERRSKAVD